jgi:branched-chain amino acid transport system substrate-binding protein
LLITDNRSDPTQAADQTRDDVLKDGVVAILGSTTPAIVNAEGDIAERDQIPLVTSLVGGSGFLNGNKSGWHYYWDIFPSEAGLAKTALGMASLAPNNKKVAVVVTEDPDGQAQGPAYIAAAKAAGDQVVYSGTVPTGTQDFSSVISKMKSKGAQVVLSLFDTPDGAALTKQMHAENYVPKVYIDQEAASLPNWLQVAGAVGEGTGTLNFWSPGSPDANVGGHLKQFDQPTTGEGAAAAYSAAKVLFDAMQRAGSTDPKKVNSAIASTNLVTPMGQIKFASDHLDATSSVAAQWQGKIQATVYPTTDKQAVKLQSPPQGLG